MSARLVRSRESLLPAGYLSQVDKSNTTLSIKYTRTRYLKTVDILDKSSALESAHGSTHTHRGTHNHTARPKADRKSRRICGDPLL